MRVDKEKIQTLIDQQRTNLVDVDYLDVDSIAKIVKDFENPKLSEGKDDSTRFQIIPEQDKAYMEAVERGDIETAQRMVNEAAKMAMPNSEFTDIFYHNSPNKFTTFDEKRNGTHNDSGWLGNGFYFYGDENEGDIYGKNKMRVFLNIEYPYFATSEDNERLANLNDRNASIEFTNKLIDEGHDGVYYNGDLRQEVVAFYPNQIKSADTVTYDDNGNVIPLSERFNAHNEDIIFQISGQDDLTNDTEAKQAATEALIETLTKNAGIEGVEFVNAEDAQDVDNAEVQMKLNALHKAENTIKEWIRTNKRGIHFEIELPRNVIKMIKAVMGRDFDSHNITANGVAHALKSHGLYGDNLSENSIPIREEDVELIPYIMVAPDYVRKGSTKNNRESVRFYKNISNGYVVVIEKEYDNSAKDLETINMWGELSNVSNAQRTLNRTSETPTIGRSDVAKIKKDAETAINNDGKIEKQKASKVKTDRNDNPIGDGSFHNDYFVSEFKDYPQVKSRVDRSNTTESVYVTYTNTENGKSVKVRFSHHENNAVKFGDELNGYIASDNEILHRLGLKQAKFVPDTYKVIASRQVSKKDLAKGIYKEADKTIQELYRLPVGTDISQYKGMLAKGSNYLIEADRVEEFERKGLDFMGNPVTIGQYVYFQKPNGEIYGYTKDGKIYLIKERLNSNTPIHEYTHLWANFMQQQSPKEWAKIKNWLKGTPVWNEVISDSSYADIQAEEDKVTSEVLSRMSARKNSQRVIDEMQKEIDAARTNGNVLDLAQKVSVLQRVKKALQSFWKWVGTDLLHIKFNNIDEVTDRVLYDFVEGADIRSDDTRFQIIGERGASALDKAEEATTRLDNLNTARKDQIFLQNVLNDNAINDANDVSLYKTENGTEVKFRQFSIFDEEEAVRLQSLREAKDIGTGSNILQRQKIPLLGPFRRLEKGETCRVERIFTESKAFDFTSGGS